MYVCMYVYIYLYLLVNGFCERQQIFVDASPAARNSVRRIAKKLNLTYSSVPLPVLRTTLAEDEGTEVDISEAEMVSRDLQVHTYIHMYTYINIISVHT